MSFLLWSSLVILLLNCLINFLGDSAIDAEAENTGQLCLFIDKLFDSVNGNVIKSTPGKELRGSVTLTSIHWEFWNEALKILNSMKYESKKPIPTIQNWIRTIQDVQLICKRLLNDGFKYVFLRNFNQDPIENFFGSIRSHGLRNINPTPANFICSFKALVLNNFTSSHSVGANCEDDDCDGVIDNLKEFLFNEIPLETNIEETGIIHHVQFDPVVTLPCPTNIVTSGSRAYVSGWIVKKIKNVTKNCSVCISKLSAQNVLKEHFIIQDREYLNCSLLYPGQELIDVYSYIIDLFNLNFHKFICNIHSFNDFITFISKNVLIGNFTCPNHNLYNIFLKIACKLLIYSYVNNVNRILSKGEKIKNTSDPVKLLAISYHNKYSKKKKVNV